jgi:hypothetical protein
MASAMLICCHLGQPPPRTAWTVTADWLWYLFTSPPLPPCQDSFSWHSRHWDEAVVWMKNGGDLGPPASPGVANINGLVMVLGYAHGGYLMARTTPSPGGRDDEDGRHAMSWRFSRRRRGKGGWFPAGALTRLASCSSKYNCR